MANIYIFLEFAKLLGGGPGLFFSFFPPPHATAYIHFLEFAKLLGGPGPPGPLNAATPLLQLHYNLISMLFWTGLQLVILIYFLQPNKVKKFHSIMS